MEVGLLLGCCGALSTHSESLLHVSDPGLPSLDLSPQETKQGKTSAASPATPFQDWVSDYRWSLQPIPSHSPVVSIPLPTSHGRRWMDHSHPPGTAPAKMTRWLQVIGSSCILHRFTFYRSVEVVMMPELKGLINHKIQELQTQTAVISIHIPLLLGQSSTFSEACANQPRAFP